MQLLVDGARAAGVHLGAGQQAQFRLYFEMLEEGNRRANLTAVRGWDRVRDELFLRSLRFLGADVARPDLDLLRAGNRLLDVGTGAGVPGLVLKLAVPRLQVTLLDANRKKTAFVADVIRRLEVDKAEAVWGRAEDIAHHESRREGYDVVVARSVARLAELAELTLPFCRVGGIVMAVKQGDIDAELREAEWAATHMGASAAATRTVAEPGPAPADTMVIWRKTSPTSREYPRRSGIPHHRPLLGPAGTRRMTSRNARS